MNKRELIEKLAETAHLEPNEARLIVDTFFDAIEQALLRDEKVEIRDFGIFKNRKRKPRLGRNPKSGKKIDIPQKVFPHFQPGKGLREFFES